MIKFFRQIRRNLMEQNKTGKYFKYAIGEIVLVVIGILIALSINNWNETRIQQNELNESIKSITTNVKSDIASLKLIKTARNNTATEKDSIVNYYRQDEIGLPVYEVNKLNREEANFFAAAFNDLRNTIAHQPNMSAFDALKNSSYYGKFQETDLGKVLNAFYTTTRNLQKIEEEHNQNLVSASQDWDKEFIDKKSILFTGPYAYSNANFNNLFINYETIANDTSTISLFFGGALTDASMGVLYNELIALGEVFITMAENGSVDFTDESKAEFSSITNSFSDTNDLHMLINGKLVSGYNIAFSGSSGFTGWSSLANDFITLIYPENQLEWGSPYFEFYALKGRINQLDATNYNKILIEMKGDIGGETFDITVKDKYDSRDGTETRLQVSLTNQWKVYEYNIAQFKTLNNSMVKIPLAFVFEGSKGRKIHIKSLKYK